MAEADHDGVTFTPEEYAEFFAEPERDIGPRRIPLWARIIGLTAAAAMLAGTATILVREIRNIAQLREPAEIRAHAIERAAESEWGWLVADFVVVPIENPDVGASVTNNPPDGIVRIDLRPWNRGRLDRLVDHELGHLLDFAVWGRAPSADRRGGLTTEAWAECAAVAAGTRSVDSGRADEEYHCFAEELAVFEAEVAALDVVCARWGDEECRSR